MLEIVVVIAKLLGSNAVGSMIGWVGGLMNRKVDLEAKRLDLADRDKDRAHEQAMRRIDLEVMAAEAASKERVASIEAEGKVQTSAWDALAESYRQEAATPAGSFSKAIRPLLTLLFGLAGLAQAAAVFWFVFAINRTPLNPTQLNQLALYSIEWVFFQGGLVVGWWFANRPGKAPELRWGK